MSDTIGKKDNTNQLMNIVYIVAITFVIIAICTFLINKDGGVSGWYVITHNGFGYIALMIFFSAVAAAAIVFGIKRYNKTQEGKSIIPYIVVAFIFLAIAFGKACTDKANNNVTGPGGAPTESK